MPVEESHYDLLRDAIFDNDQSRAAELLSSPGVDVDRFDAGGQTLLHLASFWGRMDIVKLLLSAGASMKTRNAAGCTALDLAVHWGHSAVAEVIRLRGGSSVWEDKFGLLQAGIEDANLQIAHLQGRYDERTSQCESLTDTVHTLERSLEEEKSAHLLTTHHLEEAREHVTELRAALNEAQQTVERLRSELHTALVGKTNAEHARDNAEQNARDLLAHRDEILTTMQESIALQEKAAHNWQRAEMAAAIADSQRSFALADRDRYQKRHGAALGELAITTARLADAESELRVLKTDLAEYMYELTRAKRTQKRAAKALEAATASRGKQTQADSQRAATAPAATPSSAVSQSIPAQNINKMPPKTLAAEVAAGRHPELAVTRGIVYPKKPKQHFSLAAREFGERLRGEERKKKQQRAQELQRAENHFLADGLRVRVAEADHFQEEFVSTVRAFSTVRADRWKQLRRERDQQQRFANDAMERSIATAPASSSIVSRLADDDSSALRLQSSAEHKLPSSSMPDLSHSPHKRSVSHRSATSPYESRLQASFFAADDTSDPEIVGTARTLTIGDNKAQVVSLPLV